MGLFKNSYEKELDAIITRIDVNCSNNYKDAAQKNLTEFSNKLDQFIAEGKLKEKSVKAYTEKLHAYQVEMKGYTHKDQKPYWT